MRNGLVAGACLLISAGLISGCFTQRAYNDNPAEGVEPATVRGHGVTLEKVNSVPVSVNTARVEVLPGKNEVALTVNSSNFNYSERSGDVHTLVFEAAPGTDYVITARRGGGRVCAFPLSSSGDPRFNTPAGCINDTVR